MNAEAREQLIEQITRVYAEHQEREDYRHCTCGVLLHEGITLSRHRAEVIADEVFMPRMSNIIH